MGTALKGFDRFVRRVMAEWSVPGAAVGIVKDGRVIYAKGYGLRDVRRGLPVTERTAFPIESATKTFTATAVGVLVDEGKLDWDTPLRRYLPGFRMHDPVATQRATPRDLLTDRTGLPPHSATLFTSLATRAGILERLPHLAPAYDFRGRFRYGNASYTVAGPLVEHATGQSWEDFVQARIFDPLGMSASGFVTQPEALPDELAVGYRRGRGGPVPWLHGRGFDLACAARPKAPACAIVSNVPDMCRWLTFQLDPEQPGEAAVVSRRTLQEIHTAHAAISLTVRNPALGDAAYALGWIVQPYRGYRRLRHTGRGWGFRTNAAFLPWEGLGVVVLTNGEGKPPVLIIEFNVWDRLLGLDAIDWVSQFKRMERNRRPVRRPRRREPSRARPLSRYAGVYRHPGYGRLDVAVERGQLRLRYNGITFRARYVGDDVFEIAWRHEKLLVTKAAFRIGKGGAATSVAVGLEPRVADIVFTRIGRGRARGKSD